MNIKKRHLLILTTPLLIATSLLGSGGAPAPHEATLQPNFELDSGIALPVFPDHRLLVTPPPLSPKAPPAQKRHRSTLARLAPNEKPACAVNLFPSFCSSRSAFTAVSTTPWSASSSPTTNGTVALYEDYLSKKKAEEERANALAQIREENQKRYEAMKQELDELYKKAEQARKLKTLKLMR